MIGPLKPTTPEQWQGLLWLSMMLFIAAGTIGLLIFFVAPLQNPSWAQVLRNGSLACWFVAAVHYAALRFAESVTG